VTVSASQERGTFGPAPVARFTDPMIHREGGPERPHGTIESIMNINLFVLRCDIVGKIFRVKTPWAVSHDSWYKMAKRGMGFRNRAGGAGKEPAASQ
jgi:hypothetical protein